jgi:predicted O-methyltransferase YrrM
VTGGGSSIAEVQALLRVLAAGRRCAEIGTAVGDGAVAMAETAASLVTVEIDPDRAAIAAQRLASLANVELLVGDWTELLPSRGPFELLFLDGGRPHDFDAVADLLEPGGLLVKDDLTPGRPAAGDAVREALLAGPRFVGAEVRVTAEMAAIIAARR